MGVLVFTGQKYNVLSIAASRAWGEWNSYWFQYEFVNPVQNNESGGLRRGLMSVLVWQAIVKVNFD